MIFASPLVAGVVAYCLIGLFFFAFAYDVYMDIWTTKYDLKKVPGSFELNPVMAWLMRVLPRGWPYIKGGFSLSWAIFTVVHFSATAALASIIASSAVYFMVWKSNWSLAK